MTYKNILYRKMVNGPGCVCVTREVNGWLVSIVEFDKEEVFIWFEIGEKAIEYAVKFVNDRGEFVAPEGAKNGQ